MEDAIAWAEAYPFNQPVDAYTFVEGAARPFDGVPAGRRAVLALGSNASPDQLKRKLGHNSSPLPVTPVAIHDHAVVFSAHFASYGSIPATLHEVEDAVTAAFVTWLDDDQLEAVHGTEALGRNYDFVEDAPIAASDLDGRAFAIEGYYRSRRGPLNVNGRSVRLAEMASAHCHLPALSQRALLRLVHRRLASEHSYTEFMSKLIQNAWARDDYSKALRALN